MLPTRKRVDVSARTRTAYHEAGHAVLGAALHEVPWRVSIRSRGSTLGRSRQSRASRAETMLQLYLAGFAAEHLLTSRRPIELSREISMAMVARAMPEVVDAFSGAHTTDGFGAVHEARRMGDAEGDVERVIERFYELSRSSLSSVWPAVDALAKMLLLEEELERETLVEALARYDLLGPVGEVQRAHAPAVRIP